jgi:glutaredoxin-related protein
MEKVILYKTLTCPKCKVLTMKLDTAKIEYEVVTDIKVMEAKGFKEAPKLEVDGVIMNFKEAIDWLKEQK